ncbi:Pol protein [Phytophthora palmivora]|uniref:Pol protein n=1 Tax=Phytophthora palmivora TaxID=4796 RepID=A0A2P4XND7_9STRA|nr:Pol protein [Phytophthora palmivora]
MEQAAFANLGPGQQEALKQLMSLLGPEGVAHLASQGPDAIHAHLEAFSSYENALLEHIQQRMSTAAPSMTAVVLQGSTRPKPLMLSVQSFEGKERENLMLWIREVEMTMSLALLHTEYQRVAVAISKLTAALASILAPNHAYRVRSRLLACRQGKKELLDYVQELRTLIAGMFADPLPEAVTTTVFMAVHSYGLVFGLTKDSAVNTGVVVFVDRLSNMAHLAAVPDTIDGKGTASLFLDRVFRQHGLPESIVSDRDPRFTGEFWSAVFKVLGTRLDMSTADHPQTDGQTERANRVVEDILRSVCAETPKRWSAMLPVVEFAMNNAVHASTGFTPFYVNGLTHPRVPLTPSRRDSGLDGGEAEWLADVSPTAVRKQVDDFLSLRLSVLRHVGDLVLLNTKNLPTHAVSAVFKTKLRPRFIGPFKVVAKKGLAYTLNLPKKVCTHPVFYVGLLKSYRDPS